MTGYPSKKKAAQDKLAQPEQEPDGRRAAQEPVAHQFQTKDGKWYSFIGQPHYETVLEEGRLPIRALYTTPPQPAQEPASVTYNEVADTMNALRKGNFSQKAAAEEVGKLKLYTTPPQRTWAGLTAEEIMDMYNEPRSDAEMIEFGREVEAKLKEKNNAA